MLKLFNPTDEKIESRNGAKFWELLRRHPKFKKDAGDYARDHEVRLFYDFDNAVAACCMKWMVKPRFQKMPRSRKWVAWDGPDLSRTEARSFKPLRLNQPWPATPEKFRKELAGMTRYSLQNPSRQPVHFKLPPFGNIDETKKEWGIENKLRLNRINRENILIGIPRGSYTSAEVDLLLNRVKALYRDEQSILRERPESFLGSAKQWTAFLLFQQEGTIQGACSQWEELYYDRKDEGHLALERHKFKITKYVQIIKQWQVQVYPKPRSS